MTEAGRDENARTTDTSMGYGELNLVIVDNNNRDILLSRLGESGRHGDSDLVVVEFGYCVVSTERLAVTTEYGKSFSSFSKVGGVDWIGLFRVVH